MNSAVTPLSIEFTVAMNAWGKEFSRPRRTPIRMGSLRRILALSLAPAAHAVEGPAPAPDALGASRREEGVRPVGGDRQQGAVREHPPQHERHRQAGLGLREAPRTGR